MLRNVKEKLINKLTFVVTKTKGNIVSKINSNITKVKNNIYCVVNFLLSPIYYIGRRIRK
jgi:hypothetical protein